MKRILVTMLMLIGMMGMAQEVIVKETHVMDIEEGDTIVSVYYVYSEDYKPKYIYEVDIFDDTTKISVFRNDTLTERRYYRPESIGFYNYFEDSIVEQYVTQSDTLKYLYLLDENDQIDTLITYYGTFSYIWEDGQVIEEYFNGELDNTYAYYDDILNPTYNHYKNFRLKVGEKFIKTMSFIISHEYEYEVVEEFMHYPALVNTYIDGDLDYKTIYKYDTYINDTPEIPSVSFEVLSVDYFDIMGRKMPKPKKGFYIERKTTDKGIISTKHYIQ